MKKSISIFAAIILLMPNMAIAQINRTVGNKISNLGDFTASNDREASRLCSQRGGNIVVKNGDRWYTCYYAQQLANTYK